MSKFFGRVILEAAPYFKVGDPEPDGYIARQEWAEVHMKAGLKQDTCCQCGRWFFPHQLSDKVSTSTAQKVTGRGRNQRVEKVTLTHRTCLECEARINAKRNTPTAKGG